MSHPLVLPGWRLGLRGMRRGSHWPRARGILESRTSGYDQNAGRGRASGAVGGGCYLRRRIRLPAVHGWRPPAPVDPDLASPVSISPSRSISVRRRYSDLLRVGHWTCHPTCPAPRPLYLLPPGTLPASQQQSARSPPADRVIVPHGEFSSIVGPIAGASKNGTCIHLYTGAWDAQPSPVRG